jgi:hypothetical protein
VLKEAFQADAVVVKEHRRGEELEQLKWQAASKRRPAATISRPQRARQRKAA